jgi:hypothetical protein
MVDNQHKKISGYRDLSQDEIDQMNAVKAAEVALGETWRQVMDLPDVDKRWAAVAKTHFEEGFMALVRSIAKPEPRF